MTSSYRYIVLLLVLMFSCIDPYWPDLEGEESLLVVDALITDNPENQYVFLSRSAPLDSQQIIPVRHARVFIQDDLGNSIRFYEYEAGKYYPEDFSGSQGRSYSLIILLEDGRQYTSEFQLLQTADKFDTLFYELESQPTTDPLYPVEGARFFIGGIPSGEQNRYYLFRLEETYRYHVDFTLEFIDIGQGLTRVDDPPPTQCWKTTELDGWYIYKSLPRAGPSSQPLPLHFVAFDSKRFSERYSLLVKQINVSETVFNLYYQVNQQGNNGSIFATQPYNIAGNIRCASDPGEIVLGSFIVGGIREKRAFFNRPANVYFTDMFCRQ